MNKRRKDPVAVELGRRGGKIGGKAKVPKGFALMDRKRLTAIGKASAKKRAERASGE